MLRVFKPYGTGSSIATMGQDSETCFVALNLIYVLNELRHSNSIFASLQRNRDVSQAQFVAGIVKTTRIDVQNEFVSYGDVVNALAIVEGEEKYTTLKLTVNSMIKKYVDKVKKRTKKKEEETEPEVIE